MGSKKKQTPAPTDGLLDLRQFVILTVAVLAAWLQTASGPVGGTSGFIATLLATALALHTLIKPQ